MDALLVGWLNNTANPSPYARLFKWVHDHLGITVHSWQESPGNVILGDLKRAFQSYHAQGR